MVQFYYRGDITTLKAEERGFSVFSILDQFGPWGFVYICMKLKERI